MLYIWKRSCILLAGKLHEGRKRWKREITKWLLHCPGKRELGPGSVAARCIHGRRECSLREITGRFSSKVSWEGKPGKTNNHWRRSYILNQKPNFFPVLLLQAQSHEAPDIWKDKFYQIIKEKNNPYCLYTTEENYKGERASGFIFERSYNIVMKAERRLCNKRNW